MAGNLFSSIPSMLSHLSRVIESAPGSSSSASEISTAAKDLTYLLRTWPRIRAVLRDAEEMQIRKESVKLWLLDLKDLDYGIQEVVDLYNIEVLRAETDECEAEETRATPRKRKLGEEEEELQVCRSTRSPLSNASFQDDITQRAASIRERFDEIAKQRQDLRTRERDGEMPKETRARPPSGSIKIESKLFGRADQVKDLVQILTSEVGSDKAEVTVIAVIGMGGVGKTSLVQHVYDDPAVRSYFDVRGWLCVSEDSNVIRLTKAAIESLQKRNCSLEELSPLQDALAAIVKEKKFLLVLDDVWNDQATLWDTFKSPLRKQDPIGPNHRGRGSKILITTRHQSVAKAIRAIESYQVGCLSENDSWVLFQQYAFDGRNLEEEKPELVDTGKEIVRKCNGLPLAVKVLGGLLWREQGKKSWKDILNSDIWDIESGEMEILGPLQLSYLYLPADLKPCFTYCAVFPKDHEIDNWQLVQLWVAEGLIQEKNGKILEDIGMEYIDELVSRSLFQHCRKEYDDRDYKPLVRMHDLIHDLAQHLSGEECHSVTDNGPRSLSARVRHMSLCNTKETTEFISLLGTTCLRTLLDFSSGRPFCIKSFKNLNHLRALGFSIGNEGFPDSINILKHLRYLNLRLNSEIGILLLSKWISSFYSLQALTLILFCTFKDELLSSISNLKHLRYLCLPQNDIEELPETIGNMKQLVYLDLSDNAKLKLLPESICLLENLQYLDLRNAVIKELPDSFGNLKQLRHLNLSYTTLLEKFPESFCKLCNLHTLYLIGSRIKELPDLIGNLNHLQVLFLGDEDGDEDGLPVGVSMPVGFGRLTALQNLDFFVVGSSSGKAGIDELKDLVDLHGSLTIVGLCNVLRVEEAKIANLKSKIFLESLEFHWESAETYNLEKEEENKNDDDEEVSKQEELVLESLLSLANSVEFGHTRSTVPRCEVQEELVLEGLEPHANLQNLSIREYGGVKFPMWFGHPDFELKTLDLHRCRRCTILHLEQLPSLVHLRIGEMPLLESIRAPALLISISIYTCENLMSLDFHTCSSLENLFITKCQRLQFPQEMQLPSNIKELHISDYPLLKNWYLHQKDAIDGDVHVSTYFKTPEDLVPTQQPEESDSQKKLDLNLNWNTDLEESDNLEELDLNLDLNLSL